MNKTKHRLAVSILTIIAMVVTLIPAMGGAEAAADTSGSISQKKTATRENPVKEVIYTYQSDGTYYVSIVADLSVYTSEELGTGELVCIDANHNSNNAVIGTDKPGYKECMGKIFAYYVIKKCVLDEQLTELSVSQGKKVHIDSSTREKLKFLGGYAEAKAPDPDFAAIDSLKITTSVRKANLSWNITDEPSTIDGYEIEQYYGSTKKQTYNVSAKSQYSRSGSKTVSIPYSGTSKFRVRTYVKHYNGMTYQSPWSDMVSCTSAKLKPSVGSVTKISSRKVRLTVTKTEGSTGTVIYQLVGKKWKKLGTTTGKSYTTTQNTAGKRKYKYKSYLKENGKTYYSSSYSKTYSPQANVMNYHYSIKSFVIQGSESLLETC